MTQPEPTTAAEDITITAPGLWTLYDQRGHLAVTRLDQIGNSWPGLEMLGRLELMLLEARLRYALDRVRDQIKAGDADA